MLARDGMGWRAHIGIWALSAALCACASGAADDAGTGGMDTGTTTRDTGVGDTGVTPPTDAMMPPEDAGDEFCSGVECEPFQYCDGGRCRDYPACRGDGSCDRPGDVCHNRRCVPGDVDVDGDGSPASEDCDETDPERYPGNTETCNMVDDDCDDMVDDGDPAVLCESNPGGGICIEGSCGCPAGTYDLDRAVPGCECVAAPPLEQGTSCEAAIDVGSLDDSGQMITVSGNVMPDDRVVWYRFRGVDAPDSACDNYHVRAHFLTNPDDTFELTVARGDCGSTLECGDMGFTDYTWATDFRASVAGTLTGQCPCYPSGGVRTTDVSVCEDDSADFFVRVRRRAGSTLSCDGYTIELSNGVYDTP